jgi:hypothetical protein
MAAAKYDFPIEQGSSFNLSIVQKDDNGNIIDMTGYCARLVWKTNDGETQTFLTTNANYSQYRFTIDGPNGKMSLQIPASVTNSYDFKSAKYDLELQSPVNHYSQGGKYTTRILYGTITILGRNSQSTTHLDCIV